MTCISEFGRSFPLGATLLPDGVNFSLYSRSATGVDLLLFDDVSDKRPSCTIRLDPVRNRTGDYWHAHVPNIGEGQLYAYRVYGPYDPARGMVFDPEKVLLDPYAMAVAMGPNYERAAAARRGDNVAHCLKGVVVDLRGYDWEGTAPLNRPLAESVIYEMHVKGFTAHPNSGLSASIRGTYRGVIEKIPYLKQLGITAVELLPVQQFDPQDCPPGMSNYWGYSPINFFAPHVDYSSDKSPLGAFREFRDMVKALHKAGIEIYLDVVFNHTAEGGADGPMLSFKGLQNNAYYILNPDKRSYANFSGCGNTINAQNSITRRLISDSLKFWVQTMHIDGFRFDLASILSRGSEGEVLKDPPVLWSIDTEPVLAGTKLIAEAWDAAGLYQVGNFVGGRWQEWNGKFRDEVRSFLRGDRGYVSRMADRLIGSPDLYYHQKHTPHRSINFVTAHDGFTLHDLVAYNDKHNEANNEGNRDGENYNRSWNCGVEGETSDPQVLALRQRQMKNFITVLMAALGTPMLTMGDEVARTQMGNNNAYCQDNEISWFDWSLVDKNAELLRFTQHMIRGRLRDPSLDQQRHHTLAEVLDRTKIQWHGVKPNQADWSESAHSIAYTIRAPRTGELFYAILNAWGDDLTFELPPATSGCWRRVVDTSLAAPEDICSRQDAKEWHQPHYVVKGHSVVVFISGKS
ncbi:MAG: glycogen debranching protein GlgX [Corallincola sp.]|nr:glycogen debranching protein GlgX [Corallincola sp.]